MGQRLVADRGRARLPAGRLRLAEGVARIVFTNGAEVKLEAPADLELVSPQRCLLHSGRLVAHVPPEAIGFKVDTPTAVIEALGTEFGVNVREGRSADVQVFSGRVDVEHRASGKVLPMLKGANLRFGPGTYATFDPLADHPGSERPNPRPDGAGTRLIQVSTATGRGKDAYVRPPFEAKIPAPRPCSWSRTPRSISTPPRRTSASTSRPPRG